MQNGGFFIPKLTSEFFNEVQNQTFFLFMNVLIIISQNLKTPPFKIHARNY